MIRINLLVPERAATPRGPVADIGQRVTLACSAILLVTAVLIGWRFWSLRQDVVQLEQEVLAADEEIARLSPIIAQVEALDTQRAQLALRVGLVEELREGQGRSVRMLDELSRAMPDGLWLTRLQQEEDVVEVEGQALALGAVSDFLANLEASGYFEPPVEVVESQLEETDQGEVVRFELRALFVVPDP